jgi:hypothetical protein
MLAQGFFHRKYKKRMGTIEYSMGIERSLPEYRGWMADWLPACSARKLSHADYLQDLTMAENSPPFCRVVRNTVPGFHYVPVFGRRNSGYLDFTLRGAVTFTSTLSLQLYTQLFLAKGKYEDFSLLVHPDRLEPSYALSETAQLC